MGLDDGNLAGWHRDPSGRHELRFWDGDAWTEHVVDEGIPGLDHPTRSGRAPDGVKSTPAPHIEPPTPPAADAAEVVEVVEVIAAEAVDDVDEPEETAAAVTPSHPPIDLIAESAIDADADSEPAADADTDTDSDQGVETEIAAVAETDEDPVAGEADDAADADAPEPAVLHTPLVASASVLAPPRESESGPEPGTTARPMPPAGGRSVRSRRGGAPVPPVPPAPTDARPARPSEPAPEPEPEPIAAESAPDASQPDPPDEAPIPATPAVGVPLRLIADAPTVASPAGNSAGSNTSAIADPHRSITPAHTPLAPAAPDATGPRVTGASPVPVKRYRPGSPPASPHAGPRALPAVPTEVMGTVVPPWYRRTSTWLTVVAVAVIVTLVVVLIGMNSNDAASNRIGGRPPAAAPQGHKVIDGDGFGIAAPAGWIVATDPGNTFPQLRRTNWATPLTATDTSTGEAVLVVELRHLAHEPQVDPELFWTDQVKDAGQPGGVTAAPPLSVHGFRANEITASGPSGKPLVAASIDTGDRTFLVAVTGATPTDAQTEFDRLIQTFDAR